MGRFRYLVILAVCCLLPGIASVLHAQDAPVWQAGDDLRGALFDAQRLLFSANRADDPAAVYAEAGGLLDDAVSIYSTQLQPTAAEYASEADAAVMAALADARAALEAQDSAAFAAARGRVWVNVLWVSHDVVTAALTQGDVTTAQAWLPLREYRQATRVTLVDSPAARALSDAAAGDLSAGETAVIAGDDLRDAYFFRLRDALAELDLALADGYAVRSAEWAGQARGYFNILRADYAAKLGEDDAAALAGALAQLEAQAVASDAAAAATVTEVRGLLSGYLPVAMSPDLIAERGGLLYVFLDLVTVEYSNAVRDGEITIAIEYQETVTFLAQAHSVYEELRPVMAARDASAVARLDALFVEIDAVVGDLGDSAIVESAVSEGLDIVQATLEIDPDANGAGATFTVIDTLLDELLLAAADGRYGEAESTRIEAYGLFESGPELRLANRAPVLSRELEGLFWEGSGGQPGLYTLLNREADEAELAAAVEQVRAKLAEAETFLSDSLTQPLAALNSASIIIREGLEAVLIVGAILAYMFKTQADRRYIAWVLGGVGAAVAFSVLTWFAAETVLTITPVQRELIEGITSLIAVAVLFYVTNWLFHKVYVVDWMQFVRQQADKALNDGHAFGLAALGFTVVYREGLETVLFYQALLFDAQSTPVLIGFVAGLALILGIAFVMLRLSKRLPVKPLFTVTTVLLLLLAFSLTGAGVRELQEANVIGATLLTWFPENVVLMELFGLFPTLETVLAQVIFSALIALTFTYSRWLGHREVVPVRRQPTSQEAS